VRIIVILFMLIIAGSLISAGYYVVKDQGRSDRALRALTLRIILSVCVFALLMLGHYFGWIGDRLN